MPKQQARLEFNQSISDVISACESATNDLGLQTIARNPREMLCKERLNILSWTWPAKINIDWQQGSQKTKVTLNGSIGGYGFIQSGHLKKVMRKLSDHIQVSLENINSEQYLLSQNAEPTYQSSNEKFQPSDSTLYPQDILII